MATPMTMPAFVCRLIAELNRAGYEAYAVGGCVRDMLMGRPASDWDITTSATPSDMLRVFCDCQVIPTGIRHGTVTVLLDGQAAEITTYRLDSGYTDGRHPDAVTFSASLTEDLRRRDFTVNAMVWHPETGIMDFFGGKEDVAHGVLRCVGDPDRRMTEDALRILRALRFASVFGFQLEPGTDAATRRHKAALSALSAERVRAELFRLIGGANAAAVMAAYPEVLAVPLPEVFAGGGTPALARTLRALDHSPPQLCCRLAILLQDCPGEAAAILRRLRTDNDTLYTTAALLGAQQLPLSPDPRALLRALHRLGEPTLRLLLALRAAQDDGQAIAPTVQALDALLQTNPCYTRDRLRLNGMDLMRLGFRGRAIGAALDALLDAVIDGRTDNEPVALMQLASALPRDIS